MNLEALGPASASDLAQAMDRRSDGLYHHLHKLESAGLVRIAAYRTNKGHHEALYELTELGTRLQPRREHAMAFSRMAGALAKHGVDTLQRAIEQESPGPLRFRAEAAWLTEDETEAVNQKIEEILGVFEQARGRTRQGRRTIVVTLLAPDEPTESQ